MGSNDAHQGQPTGLAAMTADVVKSQGYTLEFVIDLANVSAAEPLYEIPGALTLAMTPGELAPEIAVGGAFEAWESYNGTEWPYPPLKDIFGGDLAVIGLCNDFIGYIIPDNDFGSMFAPLHYEESVSAGGKTASNIVSGFIRLKEKAEKLRGNAPIPCGDFSG